MEEKPTTAQVTSSDSMPSKAALPKDEPQSRVEQATSEVPILKLEPPTLDAKEEMDEPDANEQTPDTMKEEVQDNKETQPLDSEDSLSQERVADELRRLTETHTHTSRDTPCQSSEAGVAAPVSEGATAPNSAQTRQGATAPESAWDWENRGSYAPQRSGTLWA